MRKGLIIWIASCRCWRVIDKCFGGRWDWIIWRRRLAKKRETIEDAGPYLIQQGFCAAHAAWAYGSGARTELHFGITPPEMPRSARNEDTGDFVGPVSAASPGALCSARTFIILKINSSAAHGWPCWGTCRLKGQSAQPLSYLHQRRRPPSVPAYGQSDARLRRGDNQQRHVSARQKAQ